LPHQNIKIQLEFRPGKVDCSTVEAHCGGIISA